MKWVFLALILASWTQTRADQIPTKYACDLMINVGDIPDKFGEAKFTRPVVAPGEHGGDPLKFTFGVHDVYVVADGKWRSISWWKDGKVIAETMSVTGDTYVTPSVTVVFNPANQEEQVSLGCEPVFSSSARFFSEQEPKLKTK